jgi:hypothetical protein
MTLRPLFITHVYEASLAGAAGFDVFNAELAHACRMLAAEDAAGRAWCRNHGYRGYTSYGSLNDLPQRLPEFAELKRRLDKHAQAYASALNFDLARKPRLDNLWVNLLERHGLRRGAGRRLGPQAGGSPAAHDDGPAGRAARRAGGGAAVRLSDPAPWNGADVGKLAPARGAAQRREDRADLDQLQLRLTSGQPHANVRNRDLVSTRRTDKRRT